MSAAAVTGGTLLSRRLRGLDVVMFTGWHLLLGGAVLAAVAAVLEGPAVIAWTPRFVLTLLFLALVGTAATTVAWFAEARRSRLDALTAWKDHTQARGGPAELLGADPARMAVVEDAVAGVRAARAGGFGLVVGADRAGDRGALEAAGADIVVADVSELDLGALRADPWTLVYEGFDPAHEAHREALTTLGNGYLGTRGAAPERAADRAHYPGTYLAGCTTG